MGSYVPGTEQERTEMLREIGFESIEQLFAHIPEEVKVKDGLQIPEGMSEFEVRKTMQKIAQKIKYSRLSSEVQEPIDILSHRL